MVSSNSDIKPKMRTLIATQTQTPGVYHIATTNNPIGTNLNEQLILKALTRIDWKSIENELN